MLKKFTSEILQSRNKLILKMSVKNYHVIFSFRRRLDIPYPTPPPKFHFPGYATPPPPPLLTSGGHLWRPLRICSLKALPPHQYWVLTSSGGHRSGQFTSYRNAFLFYFITTCNEVVAR